MLKVVGMRGANCIILFALAGTLAGTPIADGAGVPPGMSHALPAALHPTASSPVLPGSGVSTRIDYCSFRDWRGRLNPHYHPFWCIFCTVFPDTPQCYTQAR